jgi:hypothetical protein
MCVDGRFQNRSVTPVGPRGVAAGPTPDAPLAHQWTDLGMPDQAWSFMATTRPHVLVVGHPCATARLMSRLAPELAEPVGRTEGAALALPDGSTRTLILQNANALGPADQVRLLEWLDGEGGSTRVIATTPEPIFPYVERGHFMTDLYYRLNVVLLVI